MPKSERKHDVSVKWLRLFFRITRMSKDLESADASSIVVLFLVGFFVIVFLCI